MAPRNTPRRRDIASRIAAGLGGGYLLAASAAAGLSTALPGPAVEAVTAATLSAYVLFPAAALWAFVPRRGLTAWTGILGTAALFGTLALITGS